MAEEMWEIDNGPYCYECGDPEIDHCPVCDGCLCPSPEQCDCAEEGWEDDE